jgi:hypothetical protein
MRGTLREGKGDAGTHVGKKSAEAARAVELRRIGLYPRTAGRC